MAEPVTLHGYRYSVYTRAVRIALDLKGVTYQRVEVDPFSTLDPAYLDLHPFGCVPVLSHGAFDIFETGAICRYVDHAFDGPPLQPDDARAIARMTQVIAIIDNYGYWPMVRQVFEHRVFRPLEGGIASPEEISNGLVASQKVLSALNRISREGIVLTGETVTLADCHLAPMIACFVHAPEGAQVLRSFPALSHWWEQVCEMPFMPRTEPDLSALRR